MIVGDEPVNSENDILGRRAIASQWATAIEQATAPRGLVFAVTGPWGSGKTSMLNMIEEDLSSKDIQVLKFNPWLFSGTDQLVSFFFGEMASQLEYGNPKQQKIASALKKYGALFSPIKIVPIVGTALSAAAEAAAAAGKFMEESQSRGIQEQKSTLADALEDLEHPVIVILDDLDRLTGQEIRDVLRMVRLTGAFPNLIYILSFDRQRVELALNEDGLPGRAYLEKIVQVMFNVPDIAPGDLHSILFAELDRIIKDLQYSRFSTNLWPDVFIEIIAPLLSTVRDVRRYVAPLRTVLSLLDNSIELTDVLALEAMRIFLPDTFSLLSSAIPGLTTPAYNTHDNPSLAEQVRAFIDSDEQHQAVLHALCMRLFPASKLRLGMNDRYGSDSAAAWLRERRVAHPDVLSFYLQLSMPASMKSAVTAELLFDHIEDEDFLTQAFNELDPPQVEQVVTTLESHQNEFSSIDPEPAIVALLNQLPRLRRPAKGFFDIGPDIVISRVVYRLLLPTEDPNQVLEIVRRALPRVVQYSSKLVLLKLIGHRKNAGHKLVGEDEWKALEEEVRSEVRSAGATDLAREWDLLRVMWWAGIEDDPHTWIIPQTHLDEPEFAKQLLGTAVTQARRQTMGSRAVDISDQLAWEPLLEVVNREEGVRRCRDAAAATVGEKSPLIQLVDKYLEGWRPPEF
ncbi:KAP family P-loop NTPase fold protein [Microbispora triticiradicis]|uniref:KAP family P-loop NTPase fold protein n=1 Tax=Microbispora triticiradicis TaxID=2200763 RepID=UPI0014052599|nr:P-loop NTPase fold protein [Microbispora triticiradicis]GLW20681.1 NTPase [Microbispora amethystogenes]